MFMPFNSKYNDMHLLESMCFVRKADTSLCVSAESITTNPLLVAFWHSDLALSRDIAVFTMEIHNFLSSLSKKGLGQYDADLDVEETDVVSASAAPGVVSCTDFETNIVFSCLGTRNVYLVHLC